MNSEFTPLELGKKTDAALAKNQKVLILGASNKPERYAYKAFQALKSEGYETVLVHPRIKEIEGQSVYNSLQDVQEKVDTISLYVNPQVSEDSIDEILALKPRRLIMNPGTESEVLKEKLETHGILVQEACTLVLLASKRF